MHLNVFKNIAKKSVKDKAPKSRRLQLEGLEERELLSVSPGVEYGTSTVLESAIVECVAEAQTNEIVDLGALEALDGVEGSGGSIVVTTSADVVDDTDDAISLREAIASAQPGDSITFDESLKGSTITLGSALTIDKSITVDASSLWDGDANAPGLALDGNLRTGLAIVTAPTRFVGLTFTRGNAAKGGAIDATTDLTIDDCVFLNNRFNPASYLAIGGVVYTTNAELIINNSQFLSNQTSSQNGGTVWAENCDIVITNATWRDNTSSGSGALFVRGEDSTVTILANEFSNNSGVYGGAIHANGAKLTINDTQFTSNRASQDGGAIWASGGELVATNVTWNGNVATERGGALITRGVESVALVASNFTNNTTSRFYGGGGAYFAKSTVNIQDVNFTGNTTPVSMRGQGGAIFFAEDVTATISGGCVSENQGGCGAGIYVSAGSNVALENAALTNNGSLENRSSSYGSWNWTYPTVDGGAIYALGTVTATNVEFVDNYAQNGAGVCVDGENALVTLNACSVRGNRSNNAANDRGGGALVRQGKLVVSGGEFVANGYAVGGMPTYGGAIHVGANGEATVDGALIKGNLATEGAGVYSLGNFTATNCLIVENNSPAILKGSANADGVGGGIYVGGGVTNLNSVTIAGNTVTRRGGGLAGPKSGEAVVNVDNTIVAANVITDPREAQALNEFDVDWRLATGLTGRGAVSSFADWNAGEKNYVYNPAYPLFVDAANGDYTLASGSVAINAGNASYLSAETTTDFSGAPRVVNGELDSGVFEYQGENWTLPAPMITTFEKDESSITFNWTSVPNADAYEISYMERGGEEKFVTIQGDSTSTTLADLVAGAIYDIKVRALANVPSATDSAWSEVLPLSAQSIETPSLVVTTLKDVVDDADDQISLREAIAYAEADPNLGDTITFAPTLDGGTIFLTQGTLNLALPTTIDATALSSLTVDGFGATNVFFVNAENVALKGLTLTGAAYESVHLLKNGATLTNCVVVGNGRYGVSVHKDATFVNCSIMNNSEGGVQIYNSSNALFVNCIISGNQCGVFQWMNSNSTLINCAIVGNKGGWGNRGGAYVFGSTAKMTLYNSIVVDNDNDDITTPKSDPSSFYGYNTLTTYTDWTDGANNFVYDATQPLFVDATNGDYTLAPGSVAIDAGDAQFFPSDIRTDLIGAARVFGENVDLGPFEFGSAPPLDPPTLAVVGRKTSAITTSWNPVDGATGYVFEYKPVDESEYTVVNLGANKTLRQIHDLPEGARYDIRVKAILDDGARETPYAEISVATPQTLASPSLNLTEATGNALNFEWDAIENAAGYKVMYKGVGDSEYTTLTLDSTNVSIGGLKPETRYYVKVCALGDGSDYKPSAFSTLTVYRTTEPLSIDAPSLSVVGRKTNAITTSWNPVDGAIGYLFEYKPVDEEEYAVVPLGANKLLRQIHDLPEGAQYQIRVKALAGENALDSEYAEITLATLRTLATPDVVLTNADDASLAFQWNPIEGATGYKVMFKGAHDAAYSTLVLDQTTSVALEGLQANERYSVKVCALGDGGDYKNSAFSTLTSYRTAPSLESLVPDVAESESLLDEAFADLLEEELAL